MVIAINDNLKTLARPDPLDLEIGVRLRKMRGHAGLSQGALAERLGVTFQQIQKYERGSNRLSASVLVRMAHYFDLSPADFLPDLRMQRG